MGLCVLVIEDNPANLELMTYLLKAFGHTPLVARDGEEGLQAARHSNPDVILCDLALPKMDGYEVARRIKAESILPGIPIIAVTASAMADDRARVTASGFDGYMTKPITPETFVDDLMTFVQKRATRGDDPRR